jgi:hypothetical protein
MCTFLFRTSGVTDHYAVNDEHALAIARSIVGNLNRKQENVSCILFVCCCFSYWLLVLGSFHSSEYL